MLLAAEVVAVLAEAYPAVDSCFVVEAEVPLVVVSARSVAFVAAVAVVLEPVVGLLAAAADVVGEPPAELVAVERLLAELGSVVVLGVVVLETVEFDLVDLAASSFEVGQLAAGVEPVAGLEAAGVEFVVFVEAVAAVP